MTLDREAINRVAHLELLAKTAVDGFLSGRHRSRFRGASLEFAQHREYVAGDDLRHLDWKVWARADRLTIKQYEAETNLATVFAVDASGSMDYGSDAQNKFEYARRTAAALAYLLTNQSDAVGAVFLRDGLGGDVPPRTGRAQFHALAASLAGTTPTGKSDVGVRLNELAERGGPRGLRILISDFYGEPVRIAAAAAGLRRRGHDVVAMHLLHPDEIEFPFDRFTQFEGLEDDARLRCDPTALRQAYRDIVSNHCAELQRRFTALGATYRLIRTDQPVGEALAALLLERMRS
jgi:uncharacterized protein (DUF58 family)